MSTPPSQTAQSRGPESVLVVAPLGNNQFLRKTRQLAADNGFALMATLAVGFVIASLATAGIITMGLAVVFLVLAWISGFALLFLSGPRWLRSPKHKVFYTIAITIVLGLVLLYEWENFQRPASPKDIADAVASRLKPAQVATAPPVTIAVVPAPASVSPQLESQALVAPAPKPKAAKNIGPKHEQAPPAQSPPSANASPAAIHIDPGARVTNSTFTNVHACAPGGFINVQGTWDHNTVSDSTFTSDCAQFLLPRHLNDPLRASLLERLPKDKPIRVRYFPNDSESEAFGSEIDKFLRDGGYQMATDLAPVPIFGLPPRATSIDVGANGEKEVWVTVGGK